MSDNQSSQYAKVFGVFGIRKEPHAEPGVFFSDIKLVEDYLDYLWGWHNGNIKLIVGGSHGVELIAEEWAIRKDVDFDRVKPITHLNGIDPFGVRNEKIIDRSTDVIIFWDGADIQLGRTLRSATLKGRLVTLVPVVYPATTPA